MRTPAEHAAYLAAYDVAQDAKSEGREADAIKALEPYAGSRAADIVGRMKCERPQWAGGNGVDVPVRPGDVFAPVTDAEMLARKAQRAADEERERLRLLDEVTLDEIRDRDPNEYARIMQERATAANERARAERVARAVRESTIVGGYADRIALELAGLARNIRREENTQRAIEARRKLRGLFRAEGIGARYDADSAELAAISRRLARKYGRLRQINGAA